MPGAGVGPGGNRVRLQDVPENVSGAGVLGGGGAEVPSAAPVGQGRTQRELVLEAVEALKTLLGQGVGIGACSAPCQFVRGQAQT